MLFTRRVEKSWRVWIAASGLNSFTARSSVFRLYFFFLYRACVTQTRVHQVKSIKHFSTWKQLICSIYLLLFSRSTRYSAFNSNGFTGYRFCTVNVRLKSTKQQFLKTEEIATSREISHYFVEVNISLNTLAFNID